MCLDTVDKKIAVTEGEGWKCFDREENGTLFQWLHDKVPVATGVWLTDRARKPIPIVGGEYPTGFHVFLTRDGCRYYHDWGNPIRKVSFGAVVASGTQLGCPIVVAREIYIHPKEKK